MTLTHADAPQLKLQMVQANIEILSDPTALFKGFFS